MEPDGLPVLRLPRPERVMPLRTEALARELRSSRYRMAQPRPLQGDDYAVVRAEQLLHMLEHGNLMGWSTQEWALALDDKARWDREHPDLAEASAMVMWYAALEHAQVRELLLRRVALQLAAGKGQVAPSLLATFGVFAASCDATDAPAAELIVALLEREAINAETGANLTFDILKGYLLEQVGLSF